jgi:hypothetical protein
MISALISSQLIVFFFLFMPAVAEQKPVIRGRVLDTEGKALQGASVFIYDSPDTKDQLTWYRPRQAKTEAGWCCSRQVLGESGKTVGDSLGPLMPGDKFSGEPRD